MGYFLFIKIIRKTNQTQEIPGTNSQIWGYLYSEGGSTLITYDAVNKTPASSRFTETAVYIFFITLQKT